jgi:hypothetical protein
MSNREPWHWSYQTTAVQSNPLDFGIGDTLVSVRSSSDIFEVATQSTLWIAGWLRLLSEVRHIAARRAVQSCG